MIAIATFVVLGHPGIALECYMDCEDGMLCPQTCDAGQNGCLAVFRDVAGVPPHLLLPSTPLLPPHPPPLLSHPENNM